MKPLVLLFAALLVPATVLAAPPGFGQRKMNIAFKDATASNVFRVVGSIAKTGIHVSECAGNKRVEIRLINVPAALVFDTLVQQLALSWTEAPDGIHVYCADEVQTDASLEVFQRIVSVDARDTAAPEALRLLAVAAGLSGAQWEESDERVTIVLRDVRLATALHALIDATDAAAIVVDGDQLRAVREPGRLPASMTDSKTGPSGVAEAMESAIPGFRACWEKRRNARPSEKVSVVVQFRIDEQGRAVETRQKEVTLPDEVWTCMLEEIARVRFPAPAAGGSMHIRYPLRFGP